MKFNEINVIIIPERENKMNTNDIGQLVQKKRKEMKLTQKQASSLCNVGTRFFSELENGKPTLEISKVFHVVNSLGMEINIIDRTV